MHRATHFFKGSREAHHRFYQQYPRRDAFRYRLGEHDAVLPLSMLGAISGLITGVVIALFRFFIEAASALPLLLLDADASKTLTQSYTALPHHYRLLIPFVGTCILGVIYRLIAKNFRYTGLSHVIVRLHRHNGKFRVRNALLQFFAGGLAIASGRSGGRKGPADGLFVYDKNGSLRDILRADTLNKLIASG